MKRLLCITIGILCFSLTAFGEDSGLWDNFNDGSGYSSQKQTAVSDEQFDKTVEKVKNDKQKGLFSFGKKNKKLKGDSIQESNETELIKGIDKELPVLLVPCELLTDNGEILPIGHYQAIFEKIDDKLYMKLYQAHNLAGTFRAWETEEDLYDEHLNYLTLDEYNSTTVKVNYGSMDYNAVVFIKKNVR